MIGNNLETFEQLMLKAAPYMSATVTRMREGFGTDWESRFGQTLDKIFGDREDLLELAVKGYVRFALDSIKLQMRFEKERCYVPKSYADVASAVYHNHEYMHQLYLPGILLSHYLWSHHYRQLVWFHEHFLPLVNAAPDKSFSDIGTGTGFYSRQMLMGDPKAKGVAYDISDHSLAYATQQVQAFGAQDRWRAEKRDVVASPPPPTPFILSVEVLEHLEDPLGFLRTARAVLQPGGYGFITAAVTAPNEDHIYLYNTRAEVEDQLREAGFEVVSTLEELAYEPKADEPVPRLVACIVR